MNKSLEKKLLYTLLIIFVVDNTIVRAELCS